MSVFIFFEITLMVNQWMLEKKGLLLCLKKRTVIYTRIMWATDLFMKRKRFQAKHDVKLMLLYILYIKL